MKLTSILAAVAASLFFAAPAWADWDPGDPNSKWVQLPDLEPTGLDVFGSNGQYPTGDFDVWLADDFECTRTGPITDIHLWGSWLDDAFEQGVSVGWVGFHLAIYSDVPAGATYSHPGELHWEGFFSPPDDVIGPHYSVRQYASANEQFYDPQSDQILGQDTAVWQYNFLIDREDAFIQQGTPDNPTVYWLAVQAVIDTPFPSPMWGWKTSRDHWNDDAVWATSEQGWPIGEDQWGEMRYPLGHPFEGESIDLSFVITTIPEPASVVLLFLGVLGAAALVHKHV